VKPITYWCSTQKYPGTQRVLGRYPIRVDWVFKLALAN